MLIAVHERSIAEYGGSPGMRDEALLESALARPRQLLAYGASPTVFDLAAAYAHGITRNHPFVDGNKRTGFLAAYIILASNGLDPRMGETDVVHFMTGVAEGGVGEAELAAWLARTCVKREA